MVNLDLNIDRTSINEKETNLEPLDLFMTDSFPNRHIGPNKSEIAQMLKFLGIADLEDLIDKTVPATIRLENDLKLPTALSESAALAKLKAIASKNQVYRSFIGMGYSNCLTPTVILRNILENPGWYTAYTPYQAEIAQGRLEALLNFQTMVIELTGLEIANSSYSWLQRLLFLHLIERSWQFLNLSIQ